jgi:hypothetical protein
MRSFLATIMALFLIGTGFAQHVPVDQPTIYGSTIQDELTIHGYSTHPIGIPLGEWGLSWWKSDEGRSVDPPPAICSTVRCREFYNQHTDNGTKPVDPAPFFCPTISCMAVVDGNRIITYMDASNLPEGIRLRRLTIDPDSGNTPNPHEFLRPFFTPTAVYKKGLSRFLTTLKDVPVESPRYLTPGFECVRGCFYAIGGGLQHIDDIDYYADAFHWNQKDKIDPVERYRRLWRYNYAATGAAPTEATYYEVPIEKWEYKDAEEMRAARLKMLAAANSLVGVIRHEHTLFADEACGINVSYSYELHSFTVQVLDIADQVQSTRCKRRRDYAQWRLEWGERFGWYFPVPDIKDDDEPSDAWEKVITWDDSITSAIQHDFSMPTGKSQ